MAAAAARTAGSISRSWAGEKRTLGTKRVGRDWQPHRRQEVLRQQLRENPRVDPVGLHLRLRDRMGRESPLAPHGPGPRALPDEQAALKCLYLTTRSLDPTGQGRARWATRWKPALNAFAITFPGRIPTQ